MQIANRLGGFSLGQADLLRRAMGKKKHKEMVAQRERFVKGAMDNGFPKKKVVRIFDLMEQFAGYGFNKSHSAAYAFLAYVTAYLKTHYPVEFMAAVLTSETGNTDKLVLYINECRELGIPLLPPDIQTSSWNFTPAGDSIRFGLGAIKNVGHGAIDSILAARKSDGKFESIYDFCEKVDLRLLNKRVLESLIKAGAMDCLQARRSQLFAVVDRATEAALKLQRARESGQHDLFGSSWKPATDEALLPDVAEWPESQILAGEKEVLGLYMTGHPLQKHEAQMRSLGATETASLPDCSPQEEVTVAGIITAVKTARSKKGALWATVSLEDLTGKAELLVFPEAYRRLNERLQKDAIVMVKGRLQMEENAPVRIVVAEMTPLDAEAPPLSTVIIRVRLQGENGGAARQLFDLFQEKPGEASVRLELEREREFQALLEPDLRVQPDAEFVATVEKICGKHSVRLL